MTRSTHTAAILLQAFVLFCTTASAGAQVGPSVPGATQPAASADTGASVIERDLAARRDAAEALPLGVSSSAGGVLVDADAPTKSPASGTARSVLAMGAVLALIVGLSWVFKRVARASGGIAGAMGAGGRAPAGLVEVLARYPVASRQTLVVLRFDRRVLLCSMSAGGRSSAGGMTTLCELDNPEDVASVLVKSRDEAGESIARSFERALDEADLSVERAVTPSIRVRTPDHAGVGGEADRAVVTRTGGLVADDHERGVLARGLENLWRGGKR